MVKDFQADIAAISSIEAIPTILDVVCRTTGMGFAAVARVTDERWIACGVEDNIGFGLQPGGELEVDTTICHEIRQSGEPVIINNVAEDGVYCGHPAPALYGFQSYISMPIVLPDGTFFGTLCAIDPRPAQVATPAVIGMFRLFAQLIAFQFAAIESVSASEARLLDERRTSEMREQFIAVLGHDLRNPLAAISAGAELLLKADLSAKAARMVDVIRGGAARMSSLIDDVMDFARGQLGSGLSLNRSAAEPLEPVLRHVIAELQTGFPNRTIVAAISLDHPIACDKARISQLFSNLLANALTHGTASEPVRVSAIEDKGVFELSVANAGDPIPAAILARIFQPFSRGDLLPNQQGLGLGLFIASEIARAHGGTLSVTSTPEETRFTFRMRLAACGWPALDGPV